MSANAVIAVLLVFGARDLLDAWAHDPYVRVGPIALALWAAAVHRAHRDAAARAGLSGWHVAAVVLSVAARLLEIHALAHLALATWFAAAAPRRALFLVLASASWSPVLGHLLFPLAPLPCNLARLAWAAAALAFVTRARGGS